jgi:hypothetical protein
VAANNTNTYNHKLHLLFVCYLECKSILQYLTGMFYPVFLIPEGKFEFLMPCLRVCLRNRGDQSLYLIHVYCLRLLHQHDSMRNSEVTAIHFTNYTTDDLDEIGITCFFQNFLFPYRLKFHKNKPPLQNLELSALYSKANSSHRHGKLISLRIHDYSPICIEHFKAIS